MEETLRLEGVDVKEIEKVRYYRHLSVNFCLARA